MSVHAPLLAALADDLHTWGAAQSPPVTVHTAVVPSPAEGGPDLTSSAVVVLGVSDTLAEGRFRDKGGASLAAVMTARVHGPFVAATRTADAVLARWAVGPLPPDVETALAADGLAVVARELVQSVPLPRLAGDGHLYGRQVAVRFTLFAADPANPAP